MTLPSILLGLFLLYICSGSCTRTSRMGHGAWRKTASAMLPKTIRSNPPSPHVVMAIKSTRRRRAAAIITQSAESCTA